jgi:prolipoprotein diacylglyceryltransferase
MAFFKWKEKDKLKLPIPEKKERLVWPHERIGDFTILAAVGGLAGAKLFHFFENWDSFMKDPWGNITSPAGLTFYGGLIVAAAILLWYAKSKKISWKYLVDCAGPAIMIAYAVGRLGCQISGDGDWGIYNTAYISNPDGSVVLADSSNNYITAMKNNPGTANYLNRDIQTFGTLPHHHFVAPSFLPTWMVAMNYTHNVIEEAEGVRINGCEGKYCNMLPVPVYPTPFYEFVMCSILFLILWNIRKRIKIPGVLFGIYLILNGAERFLIEKIRVNTQYHFGSFHPSQAQIISTLLVVAGFIMIGYCRKTGSVSVSNRET